jgi:hypothetical protein
MALIIADRVRETTATTGTGTYNLAGAVTGYQSFSSVCSDSDTVYYVVTDNSDYEIGLGTFTSSGTTLARTTIYESSNSDAAVDWSAGDKQVFITVPASRFMYLDASGDLNMADNAKINFGASDDLQIYHDGSNSYIQEGGTGQLVIRAEDLRLQDANGTNWLQADTDGAVRLYHNNSRKLATTSTGISVTGNATFADNGKAIFGAGSDLQIYHDGTDSVIKDTGTGNLVVTSNGGGIFFRNNEETETYANFNNNGSVQLRHDNATKFETTSTGATITGSLDVTDVATTQANLEVDPTGTAVALAIALG